MATPAERAKAKQHHRHGRRHHEDPRKVARSRIEEQLRAGGWRGPLTSYVSAYGMPPTNNTNPPVSGPAPADMQGPSGHINPEQFVGYPGGYATDAGNYTGVQAIEGAAGNGGVGGDAGASGGAPS